jgi:hypothetical protein
MMLVCFFPFALVNEFKKVQSVFFKLSTKECQWFDLSWLEDECPDAACIYLHNLWKTAKTIIPNQPCSDDMSS